MVTKDRLHTLIATPDELSLNDLGDIQTTLEKYPYFQSLRSVFLKGLKLENSPSYNQELQRTAAHTSDRAVLFDYITSKSFIQNRISTEIKRQQEQLNSLEIEVEEFNVVQEDFNENSDFTNVTDDDLFVKKDTDQTLNFEQSDAYSFSEWLKLTSLSPIKRSNEKSVVQETDEIQDTSSENSYSVEESHQRSMDIIDKFLKTKPKKIKPVASETKIQNLADQNMAPEQFMTETLAKVYLAQKNYKKAIKAYEILKLQYPEKSSFFADQIQEIKNLQSNP